MVVTLTIQVSVFVFFFGGMHARLVEMQTQLLEIKSSLVKIEDRREAYAERFASLEQRVNHIDRYIPRMP
jgi:hypothetical protein